MLACINGSEKVVSMLLEAGAKTDYRTFNRETASQLAEHYEHPTIVDLINSYSSKAVAKP
jgi:ankyrin repeat protein